MVARTILPSKRPLVRSFALVLVLGLLTYSRLLVVPNGVTTTTTTTDVPKATTPLAVSTVDLPFHSPIDNLSFCFVVAVYDKWAAHADQLQRVDKIPWYNQSHFFAFSNLPRLKCKGWTLVVQKYPQYQRYITKSRVPKFLGFQEPILQKHCQVVFYQDSIGHIKGNYSDFLELAKRIYVSEQGHAQYPHRGGGGAFGEFRRIEYFGKDSRENIQASKDWLLRQPDFPHPSKRNCTLYENRYMGYVVGRNSTFSKAAQDCFWPRYSQELDSWRDQPLWCYCLDKYNITPIDFPHQHLFQLRPHRKGKRAFKYVEDGNR